MPQHIYDALVDMGFSPRQSDGELWVLTCFDKRPQQTDPDDPAEPILRYSHLYYDRDSEVEPNAVLLPSDSFRDVLSSALSRLPQPVPQEAQDDTVTELWDIFRSVPGGRPSTCYTPQQQFLDMQDMKTWDTREEAPPFLQPELLKWRHWKPSQLKIEEPTTQRQLELHLRANGRRDCWPTSSRMRNTSHTWHH